MAKSYEIVVSGEAGRNIRDAMAWIAEANPSAAEAWFDGLIEALRSLASSLIRE